MKVVSVAEMREIDERAQSEYGISGFDLMLAAGRGIAEQILREFNPPRVCVVCGKGNNAGDGFVIAQRLHVKGRDVDLVCLESMDAYGGAAKQAWEALSGKIPKVNRDGLGGALAACDLVVDALLGTGISGAPRGEYAAVIQQINECDKPVVAVDVPSGLREMQPDEEPGEIVRATLTVSVGLPKKILLTQPGAQYTGRLTTLTINFPDELLESDDWQLNWPSSDDLRRWLPARGADSNKGTYGNVGIIGSKMEYAGATALVARGALRAGCGLATIYTLPRANLIYKSLLPEATSVIIGQPEDDAFSSGAVEDFISKMRDHRVLTVGPGLGTEPGTGEFLLRLLSRWTKPLILDADALNLLAGQCSALQGRADCLITPHPGEMARLTGLSTKEVQANREPVARDFAEKYGINVLLKGAGTLVARPDGQTWIIPGAEPALAKGGTGDVLTGVIAALFAQGMCMWQAAVLGAWAHLQAGIARARIHGKRGVLASEVADEVPLVLDRLEA